MDPKLMRVLGIVALVLCLVCVFVAFERYNTNARNVRAMNQFQQSSPLGGMMGQGNLKPATPAATKYAILLAVILGVGGGVMLVAGGRGQSVQV